VIACYFSVLLLFSKPNALVHPIISLVSRFHCLFFVVICGPIFSYAMRPSFLIEWQKILTEILRDKFCFGKLEEKAAKNSKLATACWFKDYFFYAAIPCQNKKNKVFGGSLIFFFYNYINS
jgi:hypothetical protein